MIFYPARNEFLVLPFSKEYVQELILYQINIPDRSSGKKFIGRLEEDHFLLNKKLNRPDNYSPLIRGTIDSSSKGVIISLHYGLMFSTKLFLLFWTLILLFFIFFFSIKFNAYTYAAASLVMAIINYSIVYVNFMKQVKICHDLFVNLFDNIS